MKTGRRDPSHSKQYCGDDVTLDVKSRVTSNNSLADVKQLFFFYILFFELLYIKFFLIDKTLLYYITLKISHNNKEKDVFLQKLFYFA